MKIEDLRINQKVRLVTTMPDWQNVPEVTIVGLRINEKGEENITVDDGSGYHYDGWKLCQILPLELSEPIFPPNRLVPSHLASLG